jgi:peptide deformylase
VKIIRYPHSALLTPTTEVKKIDESVVALARQMLAKMYEVRGLGLSANQVGSPIRLAVINPTGKPEDEMALVNPAIVARKGRMVAEEGCLSFPEIFGKVARSKSIVVEFLDLEGRRHTIEADEFVARVFQHEVDHLDGVVFVSRMTLAARAALSASMKKLEKEFESEKHQAHSL